MFESQLLSTPPSTLSATLTDTLQIKSVLEADRLHIQSKSTRAVRAYNTSTGARLLMLRGKTTLSCIHMRVAGAC